MNQLWTISEPSMSVSEPSMNRDQDCDVSYVGDFWHWQFGLFDMPLRCTPHVLSRLCFLRIHAGRHQHVLLLGDNVFVACLRVLILLCESFAHVKAPFSFARVPRWWFIALCAYVGPSYMAAYYMVHAAIWASCENHVLRIETSLSADGIRLSLLLLLGTLVSVH